MRGRLLRLHGAGRDPGPAEPPEEGPPVRAGGAAPPPGGAVRRGRRRPTGGHRLRGDHRTRHPGVRPVRTPERPGAPGRDRLGVVLRRQRRPARLLRRDHRHRRDVDRHGRSGHDRGRRPRHLPARGGRPARRAGRRTAWSTWWRRTTPTPSTWPGATCPTSRGRSTGGPAPTSGCCARPCPSSGCAPTTSAALIDDPGRHRTRCWSSGAASAPGMVTALARIEGRPVGVVANDPTHLGGAIDADGADKAARFLQLCDAHDLPGGLAVRHAGVHGRTRGGADRPGPPRQPDVRHRGQPDRAAVHHRAPQGLRPRRPGHGRRQLPGAALPGGLAERRARGDGTGGRGAPRVPPRARGGRGPGGARGPVRLAWSTWPTSTARRSTWPPPTRSTT